MAKRAPGTGSIIKYGKRQWRAYLPVMPGGSRPSKIFDKQADAVQWLDEQLETIRKNEYIAPSDQTLGDWLVEFVSTYKSASAASTLESYQGTIGRLNKHAPDLMGTPLQGISNPAIQRTLNSIRKDLSARTTEITRTLLNMALSRAVKLNLIKSNPVNDTEINKDNRAKKANYIEPDMLDHIISTCMSKPYKRNQQPYYDAILHIARTGCRTQEVRGLKVDRLTPNGCHINSVLDRQMNEKIPKSTNSLRYIVLPDDVLNLAHDRAKHSISGYVYETLDGKPLRHESIARMLRRITDGKHSPHDLRHTFMTNAIRHGANPKAVADYTGDTVATILKVYVHTNETDMSRVLDLANKPSKVINFKPAENQ